MCDFSVLSLQAKENYKVIFVLGGPGSGKGTACARLEKSLGLHHISAGDELRAARDRGDSTAKLINSYINEGKIVPVEITCDLLKKAMKRAPIYNMDGFARDKTFLIDGFPRNYDNIDGWKAAMASRYNGTEKPNMKNVCVLHLVADEEEMTKRCLSRAEEQGRSDDNEETIRKRYRTYVESTKPVVDRFREEGLLVDIDANQSAEAVYRDIEAALCKADPRIQARVDRARDHPEINFTRVLDTTSERGAFTEFVLRNVRKVFG